MMGSLTRWRNGKIGIATTLIVGLVAGLLPLLGSPAQAFISSPAAGDVVQGVVEITEANGAAGGNGCGNNRYSRIEVHRLDANGTAVEQVFSQTQLGGSNNSGHVARGYGESPWTASWNSVGHPNGPYRVQSFLRNSTSTSGTASTCNNALQNEIIHSDFVVTLENRYVAVVSQPEAQPTGEPLPLHVTALIETTDILVPNLDVTLDISGVGSEVVTTDENGEASTVVNLPDLPAGTITVDATTAANPPAFAGSTSTTTTELTHRSTETTWDGDLRGDPGDVATLAATVTDATPDSARNGEPIGGLEIELSLEDTSESATTGVNGRAVASAPLEGPDRAVPAGASFAGTDVWAPSSDSIEFFIGDDASQAMPHNHSTVGGITRMVGGVLGALGGAVKTVSTYVGQLLPFYDTSPVTDLIDAIDEGVYQQLPVDELDAALGGLLGPVGQAIGPVGDPVDAVLDEVLNVTDALLAQVGPALPGELQLITTLLGNLRFEWQAVYVAPNGEHVRHSFGALIAVPEPLDVTGDGRPDVLANLTVIPTNGDLPVLPRLQIAKLPGAPESLPLSLQAVLDGDGLVSLGGGRLRLGYDTRHSTAPDAFEADLGLSGGNVRLDMRTEGGEDLALTGALEESQGEVRFSVNFEPVPERTTINLGIGDLQNIEVSFQTSKPSKITMSFVDDTGTDEVFELDATFDEVLGLLSLVLEAGAAGGGVPDLNLDYSSTNPLDRVHIQGRGYEGGAVVSDLLLSLEDVPTSLVFGSTEDGGLSLQSSAPVGLMEAGFASGGAISKLDEEAFLYMVDSGDYSSVALRLPGVESLSVNLGDPISLDLVITSAPLRAKVESDSLSLDAKIYDAPREFSLGLAPDGTFIIDGSAPIDLITMVISDESGIFLGATDVNVRIEQIPGQLTALVGEEGAVFDAVNGVIGLFEMVATSGPEVVLPPDQDSLIVSLVTEEGAEELVLGVRLTGLRRILADVESFTFELDTVAERILNMDLNVNGLEITGFIDHLVPGVKMGVSADEDGNLTGLTYEGSRPTNSMSFNIPGFADFAVNDPLPAWVRIAADPDGSLRFHGSEFFTLNLSAELDGIAALITDMRLRWLDYGGDFELEPGEEDDIAFPINTTEFSDQCPDGCVYPVGRLTDAAGQSGPTPLTGTIRLGPIPDLLGGTVTFRPRGMSATDGVVVIGLEGSLIPSAVHRRTVGDVHCTGTSNTNGTNLIAQVQIILTITIQMRGALCGGSTARADLEFTDVDAPAAVVAGAGDLTHSVTARNAGPNGAAQDLTILAEHNEALGDPIVDCPDGGTPAVLSETEAGCTWAGPTALGASRTMDLTWDVPEEASGSTLEVEYTADSATAGNSASASATTTVQGAVANLEIIDFQAPESVVSGQEDVVHRVDARNNGPSDAENMRITVDHNGELGAVGVTCSGDGIASAGGCEWEGDTAPAEEVWAEFEWAAPEGTTTRTLEASYELTSDTPGAGDSASASTEVIEKVADLDFIEVDGSDRVLPGEDIVHSVTVTNTGPSAGDTLRILADHDGTQGSPDVTCSDGGVLNLFTEINRARCLWLGDTAVGAERTMDLVWQTSEETELGTTFGVGYRATSNTPGADAVDSLTTIIDIPEQADIEITGLNAPEIWASGGTAAANSLIHSVTATNNGPHPASDLTIVADHTGLGAGDGNPTGVSCAGGGVVTNVPNQVTCVWANNNPGQSRTMQLTWNGAAVTAAGPGAVLEIDYTVGSDTPGAGDSASVSTEILGAIANLAVTGGTGPETVVSGTPLTHSASVARSGTHPAGAAGTAVNLRIDATTSGLDDPTGLTCTTGGTSLFPGELACVWAGNTTTQTRTLTLTWNAGATAVPAGTVVETDFVGTSDTPGTVATVTRTTEVIANEADLEIVSVTAPSEAETGTQLAHRAVATNTGPAPASDVQILATHNEALGDPAVECSGILSGETAPVSAVSPGEASCTWPGGTAIGRNRTITLRWDVGLGETLGTTVETVFDASSSTSGSGDAAGPVSTTVVEKADMEITSLTAPASVDAGETLVHRLDARNAGPSNAQDLRIDYAHNGALGDPTVTCSGAGNEDGNGCLFDGATGPAGAHWLELEWAVDAGEEAGTTLESSFSVSSSTPGAGDSAEASSEVTTTADLLITNLVAPGDVAAGDDAVHTIEAENTGPSVAAGLRITASHNGEFGDPVVDCSAGGVSSVEDGVAGCEWETTDPNVLREMTLTWSVSPDAESGDALDVTYTATSDTPGGDDVANVTTTVL